MSAQATTDGESTNVWVRQREMDLLDEYSTEVLGMDSIANRHIIYHALSRGLENETSGA